MGDKLIKLQLELKKNIEKGLPNFKKSPKERITIGYIEARLESLEKAFVSFISNHQKLVNESAKESLEQTDYYLANTYDECEETYLWYKGQLKDALSNLKPRTSNPAVVQPCTPNIRLPKIEIPKFSGKYSEWMSFRDLFLSLVHKQSSLDNVQKLHYLKGYITGEAEQLYYIADNYKVCWEKLEGRYSNKRYQANCILKRLAGQKNLSTESSIALKQLLDTTKECLSALVNLGIDTKGWDVIIVFLVSQKLDAESRRQWEQRLSESTQDFPSLTSFEEFLENRFRSLEFLDLPKAKQEKSSWSYVATSAVMTCPICGENHKLSNCKKFAKDSVDARRTYVQNNSLCFNCMLPGHSVYQCSKLSRCRLCKKKHHTLLHTQNPKPGSSNSGTQAEKESVVATVISSPPQPPNHNSGSDPVVVSCFSNANSQVLLATAIVKVRSNKTGTSVVLRSLLDQGSQASFVTEAAVQMLGLRKTPETSLTSGLGGDQSTTMSSRFSVVLRIQSRLDPSFAMKVKAHVLNKLTTFLPHKRVFVQSLPSFPSMELADPMFHTPNKIDLLLGAEVYSQILLEGLLRGLPGSLVAQNTTLGWILSGKVHDDPANLSHGQSGQQIIVSTHVAQHNEDEQLKKFFELESDSTLQKKKHFTPEEEKCEKLFHETTTRDDTGRFVVKLPFKTDDPLCKYGNSRAIAHKRFLSLERRFMRDPALKVEYSKVINEYLRLGHMEVVDKGSVDKPDAVYLPHHAVVRLEKTTSPVRVVFDGSCKYSNGVSLNDDLMVGPTFQPELRHLVMRWRCYSISLVADIVKMYRQVKVAEEDSEFQRILWRENPGDELQHLRLMRITFGTSSAPYLAVRALVELALVEGQKYPSATRCILKHFYMDDLMSGCHSVEEGVQIVEELTQLLSLGGFPLQKISSNSNELLHAIQVENNEAVQNLELKTDEVMKILGLTWKRNADEFTCTVKLPAVESPPTKRKVISDIARLFDPLGWVAPVVIRAKIFIQQLWLSGIEWDCELPATLLERWLEFRSDLTALVDFSIPRWIGSNEDDRCFDLHGFSDASNTAFAAIVYARIVDKKGDVHVSLITSKTRVAPIKQVSIPRLELCGAMLLSKLLVEVAETLGAPKANIHAWTDSTIVLAWLQSHPSRWKTFIANRVSEILTIMDSNQWSHVSSKDNPADCASRGMSPSEFVGNKLWKQGPDWLHQDVIDYGNRFVKDTTLEERKHKVVSHAATVLEESNIDLLSRFSSLTKLVRVVAFCRRVMGWKKPERKREGFLTAKELDESLLTCIKLCQRDCFKEEIQELKKGSIKKNSKLKSLSPYLDSDEVLRVGGRLQSADVDVCMKHPIIIPHKSPLTALIIQNAHLKTMHGGPQLMLNYLRTKYWVINSKRLVRSYVHKCVNCIRYSAQTTQQMMGQLPSARVNAHRPFLRCGVDYAGPISIRTTKGRGHCSTRGYICLFVCMATRAIHLEVVGDMTSEAFIAAFRRFVSRRGHVPELWSDNGTTFVGSARELEELFDIERSNVALEIANWFTNNGTAWHFIPPRSPNFGGLWEAGIRSTKHHLKRVIGNSTLTFEEMSTVLAQIEACLNSRPISPLSNNPEDPTPLTPGHFLIGEPLVMVPDANFENSNITNLKRWHLTQKMIQDFWRRWSMEYLTQLQHRYKWSNEQPEPDIDSVVLVKEDDLPPAKWLFGVIVDKHPGIDNLTRVVSLKYKGHVIKRPVSKLIVLPTKD